MIHPVGTPVGVIVAFQPAMITFCPQCEIFAYCGEKQKGMSLIV